ncbi:hypothetical protein Plhal304r1_c040g0117521 [Plasmopara halstedii]
MHSEQVSYRTTTSIDSLILHLIRSILHVSHFPALRRVSSTTAPQRLSISCFCSQNIGSLTTNFCKHSTSFKREQIAKPFLDSLRACDPRTSGPIMKQIVDSILILLRHSTRHLKKIEALICFVVLRFYTESLTAVAPQSFHNKCLMHCYCTRFNCDFAKL